MLPVITIDRQYGSGGREIGRRVAERLSVPFYDEALLDMAAEKAGLHPEVVRSAEEQRTSSLLYGAVTGMVHRGAHAGPVQLPITDQVFLVQSEIIRELAEKGPCVIIGRAADYVLREHTPALHVFVHGDVEVRVARCLRFYGIDEQEARDRIRKIDKRRASYYQFFTHKSWGAAESFHLSLDVGLFGADGCAALIEEAVKRMQNA